MAFCCMPGRSSMALFTRTAKLDPGAYGARCARAMAVHHAVGISRQRNSGYRPSRVNITARSLSTPDASLSPTHLSIRRGRATTTHYTHHQVSLVVLRNTTLVPSLGLRIGPACEAGLSAGMRKKRVSPQIRKKERMYYILHMNVAALSSYVCSSFVDQLLILMGTSKPQSNGPLYSKPVIGSLAVNGWAVTLGTTRRG